MIIAILEDRKGFRKAVEIPSWRLWIKIPAKPKKQIPEAESKSLEIVTFRFSRWLEGKNVALYFEK